MSVTYEGCEACCEQTGTDDPTQCCVDTAIPDEINLNLFIASPGLHCYGLDLEGDYLLNGHDNGPGVASAWGYDPENDAVGNPIGEGNPDGTYSGAPNFFAIGFPRIWISFHKPATGRCYLKVYCQATSLTVENPGVNSIQIQVLGDPFEFNCDPLLIEFPEIETMGCCKPSPPTGTGPGETIYGAFISLPPP